MPFDHCAYRLRSRELACSHSSFTVSTGIHTNHRWFLSCSIIQSKQCSEIYTNITLIKLTAFMITADVEWGERSCLAAGDDAASLAPIAYCRLNESRTLKCRTKWVDFTVNTFYGLQVCTFFWCNGFSHHRMQMHLINICYAAVVTVISWNEFTLIDL